MNELEIMQKRLAEIKELQAEELRERVSRMNRSVRTHNSAKLIADKEIPRQQGLCFIYGMPEAWLRAKFPDGEPPEDICLKKLKGKEAE